MPVVQKTFSWFMTWHILRPIHYFVYISINRNNRANPTYPNKGADIFRVRRRANCTLTIFFYSIMYVRLILPFSHKKKSLNIKYNYIEWSLVSFGLFPLRFARRTERRLAGSSSPKHKIRGAGRLWLIADSYGPSVWCVSLRTSAGGPTSSISHPSSCHRRSE